MGAPCFKSQRAEEVNQDDESDAGPESAPHESMYHEELERYKRELEKEREASQTLRCEKNNLETRLEAAQVQLASVGQQPRVAGSNHSNAAISNDATQEVRNIFQDRARTKRSQRTTEGEVQP